VTKFEDSDLSDFDPKDLEMLPVSWIEGFKEARQARRRLKFKPAADALPPFVEEEYLEVTPRKLFLQTDC
jgi:hypothetical protein